MPRRVLMELFIRGGEAGGGGRFGGEGERQSPWLGVFGNWSIVWHHEESGGVVY